MKNIVIVLLVLLNVACTAQSQKQNSITNKKGKVETQPDISWKVDKQVDENGNIIRYDSTYTWSYSTNKNLNMDSLMRANGFNLNEDFFTPNWNHNFSMPHDSFFNYRSYFNNMHKQMDDWMKYFFDDPFLDNHFPQQNKIKKEESPNKKTSSTTNWY